MKPYFSAEATSLLLSLLIVDVRIFFKGGFIEFT